jgi:hypothetical protein
VTPRQQTAEELALRALLESLSAITARALAEGAGLSLARLRAMAAPSNRNVPTAANLRALADSADRLADSLKAAAKQTRKDAKTSHR